MYNICNNNNNECDLFSSFFEFVAERQVYAVCGTSRCGCLVIFVYSCNFHHKEKFHERLAVASVKLVHSLGINNFDVFSSLSLFIFFFYNLFECDVCNAMTIILIEFKLLNVSLFPMAWMCTRSCVMSKDNLPDAHKRKENIELNFIASATANILIPFITIIHYIHLHTHTHGLRS